MDRRLGISDNREERLTLPGCAPVQSGGLRVAVDQDDAIAKGHQLARDIGREGRLSDTTLLVKESNGRHRNTEKRKSVLL